MDYREGEDHTIARAESYRFWRSYAPQVRPEWPGKLLSLTYSHPITLQPRKVDFDPRPGATTEGFNLWLYRRLIDPDNFLSGAYESGISLVNWPQNDYLLGDAGDRGLHHRQARALSLSLFYWLLTEAPRKDGGAGWPGLRGDILGTEDGLPKRPYIRASRRIRARFTVRKDHMGQEARMLQIGRGVNEVRAAHFADSVGLGSYRIDLHPSTESDNYINVPSLPFEIPLGALLPVRVENLLPACKNIGVTHITNGCYRLHPVEWNIGEAAGRLAAFCLNRDTSPHAVHGANGLLQDFQRALTNRGIEIAWPPWVY